MSNDNIVKYGYFPVPRDPDVLFKDHPTAGGPDPQQASYTLAEIPFPDSELVRRSKAFVEKKLNEPTFNHSHRVYVYGTALVKKHFPDWKYDDEAYYLSCLFHDIGTADAYLSTTKMSFEFKGGIVAREFIIQHGGEEDLADAICEAVIRHQDIFVKGGNITAIGQVLQLATIIDNVGIRANLLSTSLIEATVAAFPRLKWSGCFASVINKELALKPWCHTSTFEIPNWKEGVPSNFAGDVLKNSLMNNFE
ncbi:cyanamide hydratase [Hysterangium stoloniferum]|nr:cyanamide hydratase [Hysterangium stoloniferum]